MIYFWLLALCLVVCGVSAQPKLCTAIEGCVWASFSSILCIDDSVTTRISVVSRSYISVRWVSPSEMPSIMSMRKNENQIFVCTCKFPIWSDSLHLKRPLAGRKCQEGQGHGLKHVCHQQDNSDMAFTTSECRHLTLLVRDCPSSRRKEGLWH